MSCLKSQLKDKTVAQLRKLDCYKQRDNEKIKKTLVVAQFLN